MLSKLTLALFNIVRIRTVSSFALRVERPQKGLSERLLQGSMQKAIQSSLPSPPRPLWTCPFRSAQRLQDTESRWCEFAIRRARTQRCLRPYSLGTPQTGCFPLGPLGPPRKIISRSDVQKGSEQKEQRNSYNQFPMHLA